MDQSDDPRAGTAPDEWAELADELSASTRARPFPLWVLVAALVAVIAIVLAVWRPWADGDGDQGATQNSSIPTSANPTDPLAGPGGPLGLIANPWPATALAALTSDGAVTTLTRILLTPAQIQATGAGADGAWQDFIYVEGSLLPLGDPLVAPRGDDEFSVADVDPAAIGVAAESVTESGTGESDGTGADTEVTQVVVARDPITDGAPVVIEVYWRSGDDLQVSRFDTAGTPLD